MIRYVLIICVLIGFLSCEKEGLDPTSNSGADPHTNSMDSLNNTTHTTDTMYSDQGQYAPFGYGSSWTYRRVYIHHDCIIDSNGTIGTVYDTSFYTHTFLVDTIINDNEYVQFGEDWVRVKEGVYYWLFEGDQDVKYLDEQVTIGSSWQTTVTPTQAGAPGDLYYTYTVNDTYSNQTVLAGSFSGVLEMACGHGIEGQSVVFHTRYYKEGIGLIKLVRPMINSSETIDLMSYQIFP